MKVIKYSVARGFENEELSGDMEQRKDEEIGEWLKRIGMHAPITEGLSSEIRQGEYGQTVKIYTATKEDNQWFAVVDVNDPEGVFQVIFCATPVDLFRLRMELLPYYALTFYRAIDDALYDVSRGINRALTIWHGHGLDDACVDCDPAEVASRARAREAWKKRQRESSPDEEETP